MKPRQTIAWLIVDVPPDTALWRTMRRLPRGSGLLLIAKLMPNEMRRLRHLASVRDFTIVAENPHMAARIHDQGELTLALLRRPPLILVSPVYPTRSHPDWRPLPLMRAATLARLAGRHAIALGGMDARRFRRVSPLGFSSWAGISAFRT
jgi:thiamine-phosphate pyrophosphorylase